MTRLDPRLAQSANDLAADSRSLDSLKRDAQRDPQGAVRKAAQQFEALFMQMVLKSMREATPKSGLFDSPAQDMYTGMLDQQLATKMSQSSTGLADVIVRQLTRHMPAAKEAAAAGSSPAAGAAPASVESPALRAAALKRYGAVAPAARATAGAPAGEAGESAAGLPASAAQRDFVTRHWDSALAAQRATGIPAQFVLSQAALESGWGKAEIRGADGLPSFNLFGIKATGGWQGRTVDVVTTEYDNGVPKKVVEKFRAYNNYSEAFRDWAQLLAGNPRYAGVLAAGRDPQGFAHGLQRAGYATDPAYGSKLSRVIASVGAALRGA
jgi:peptidoglycan hydrolase FlgJ